MCLVCFLKTGVKYIPWISTVHVLTDFSVVMFLKGRSHKNYSQCLIYLCPLILFCPSVWCTHQLYDLLHLYYFGIFLYPF